MRLEVKHRGRLLANARRDRDGIGTEADSCGDDHVSRGRKLKHDAADDVGGVFDPAAAHEHSFDGRGVLEDLHT